MTAEEGLAEPRAWLAPLRPATASMSRKAPLRSLTAFAALHVTGRRDDGLGSSARRAGTSTQCEGLNMRKIDHVEEGKTKSINDQIAADKVLQQQANDPEPGNERAAQNAPLTANQIEDRVAQIVQSAATLFFTPEQRVLATNGRAYPVDYDFEGAGLVDRSTGQPVLDTGSIVTVDKYAFLDRGLAMAVPRALEYMLRNAEQGIAKQRNAIQNEIRFGRNAGTDVGPKVDRMADWLATLVEQAALIEVAFRKAIEAYADETGDVFPSQEQKAQVATARMDSLDEATKAKLAKLGVTQTA
jgi:hypothetical protein